MSNTDLQKLTREELIAIILRLDHELSWLKRQMFGQKTERYIPNGNGQLAMELPGAVETAPVPVVTQKISYERQASPPEAKNGHGRNVLPAHLPRVDKILEPTEDVTGMQKIGEEVTEELEYKPGKLFVNRIIRPKYAMADGSGSVVTAALPIRPIEKGRPGPGLIAHVMISKYVDHLPLYRQEKMFKREKVSIPRSTLGGWIEGGYGLLLPMHTRLVQKILAADYLQADETPVRVQDEQIPGKTHPGYFFAYRNPMLPAVVFDYQESRGRAGPMAFLEGFKGCLQTDAYAGYNEILAWPGVKAGGCFAHARRKFFDAKDNDPARAEVILKLIGHLYTVEDKARGEKPEDKLSYEERYKLRQMESVPIMAEIKTWLNMEAQKTLPKSSMGQAIRYTLNIWNKLETYLTDGRYEIDNNLLENAIRPVALGRKNWLFAGSHEGAKRSALIYSFVGTCAMQGIEPFEYLRNVIDKLPGYPQSKIDDLLPLK
jgi:transposase